MILEEKGDPCHGRNSGSFVGYEVEVRVPIFYAHKPVVLIDGIYGKIVLSEKWRHINFRNDDNDAGVYSGSGRHQDHGLLPRNSAIALAWTVIAQHPYEDIEARIIPYRVEYKEETFKLEDKIEMIGNVE